MLALIVINRRIDVFPSFDLYVVEIVWFFFTSDLFFSVIIVLFLNGYFQMDNT